MLTHEPFSPRWEDDFRQSIRSSHELETWTSESTAETPYPLFLPRPFLSKILAAGKNSPLWKQFIPDEKENHEQGELDPIGDERHSKGFGIIHRYKNRILFSPTEVCPVLCRYCFRKNELHQDKDIFKANLERALEYVRSNPQVEEVIFTGGDPLILSDAKIETLLKSFSQIPSIKMVRFHSRTPVILPNRMTPKLIKLLEKYTSRFSLLSLVIHTNHLSEWSPEFLRSLEALRKTPVNLMSQSVLLKGVNDNVEDLAILFKMLMTNGVRPYYLHHPDPVKGGSHFLLSLEEGRDIYSALKSSLSGFILPRYVVELPEGEGKAFAFQSQNAQGWLNHEGKRLSTFIQ